MCSIHALLGGDSDESDESDVEEKLSTPHINAGPNYDGGKIKNYKDASGHKGAVSECVAPRKRQRSPSPYQNKDSLSRKRQQKPSPSRNEADTLCKESKTTTKNQQLSKIKRISKQDRRQERHRITDKKSGRGVDVSIDRDQRGEQTNGRDRGSGSGPDKRNRRTNNRDRDSKRGEWSSDRERKNRHERDLVSGGGVGRGRDRDRSRLRNRENRSVRARSRERGIQRGVKSSRDNERSDSRNNRKTDNQPDGKGKRDNGHAQSSEQTGDSCMTVDTGREKKNSRNWSKRRSDHDCRSEPGTAGPQTSKSVRDIDKVTLTTRTKQSHTKTSMVRNKPRNSRDRRASGESKSDRNARNQIETGRQRDHTKMTKDRQNFHNSRDRSDRGRERNRLDREPDKRDNKGNRYSERAEKSDRSKNDHAKTVNDKARGSRDWSSRNTNRDKISQRDNENARNIEIKEQNQKTNEANDLAQKMGKKQRATSKSPKLSAPIRRNSKDLIRHAHRPDVSKHGKVGTKHQSRSPTRRPKSSRHTESSSESRRDQPSQQARPEYAYNN